MIATGLRGRIYVAILVSIIAGAVTAGAASYHIFERGLYTAFEARLQLIVDEAERVLDAGVRAGLNMNQTHLLLRALAAGTNAEGPATGEIVAIVDAQGRIIASTNGVEVGEMAPPSWGTDADPANLDRGIILARQPISSLFGTTEGMIVARLPIAVMNTPSEAFLFRVLVTATLAALVTALIAALLLWLVPWGSPRRAAALRDLMDDLYDRIGGSGSTRPPGPLPKPIEAAATAFQERTVDLSERLQREADELTRLDEVA